MKEREKKIKKEKDKLFKQMQEKKLENDNKIAQANKMSELKSEKFKEELEWRHKEADERLQKI